MWTRFTDAWIRFKFIFLLVYLIYIIDGQLIKQSNPN